jgi:hypothetical protein
MSTKPITPRLADNLRLLAASQLHTQAARSAALDGGAHAVMAVDAAVAAIVIGVGGTYGLWIAALSLLVLSAGMAIRVVRMTGAEETGPLIDDVLAASETAQEDRLERSLCKTLPQTYRPTGGHWLARVCCSTGHRRSWYWRFSWSWRDR